MEISVIVCGHNEGRLLHRTLKSVFRALDYLKTKLDIEAEILLSLDNPDKRTLEYLKECQIEKRVKVFSNSFGDVGLSRNFAATKAGGKYLAFIDGDDIFAENWLHEAYTLANKNKKEEIYHPEYYVGFGERHLIWRRISSISSEFKYGALLYVNPWDMTIFLPKSIFSKHQFQACPKDSGWGYEDYHFFCDTLGAGVEHIVVPETAVFIRAKKENSLLKQHSSNNTLLRPTTLFELENLKNKIVLDSIKPLQRITLKKRFQNRYPRLHLFLWKLKNDFFELIAKAGKPIDIPKWLTDEWKSINSIEPDIFPSSNVMRNLITYSPVLSDFMANKYVEILEEFNNCADHLIFVPFIKIGGAEKVLFNFIEALQKIYPSEGIRIVSTEPYDSPCKDRLPKNVKFYDIGNLPGLDFGEKEILLARLLVQLSPKSIYNLSSIRAFELISKYKRAISAQSDIFTFVFCPEYDENGQIFGFAFSYLDDQIDYNKKIFTDNQKYIEQLSDIYGFDKTKFVPLYQPAEVTDISEKKYSEDEVLKLLWASRLDHQKHPEVIYKIAKSCEDLPIKIDVYGTKVLDHNFDPAKLQLSKNIEYKGPYSKGLKEIPSQYDGFIYTSQYDGMPNVILEAIGLGIPVISSNVGGIGDLLEDRKSALLVDQYNDIEGYRKQIEYALAHRKEFNEYAKVAQKEMLKKHNWETLEKTIKESLK